MQDFNNLRESGDIAGLILAVENNGHDDAIRQEAIVALGQAVCYWSGYRIGTADKKGVQTLMQHQKNDPNQLIRMSAGHALGLLRGVSLMGDAIVIDMDVSYPGSFQKTELDSFQQASQQGSWMLALERIEEILKLPEEASQPDDLVGGFINMAGTWPMDNQPTAVATRWLRIYLSNTIAEERELVMSLWVARGETMFNAYVGLMKSGSSTNVGFRLDTLKGLIYAGTTQKVLWDNADAVGIAGCLLFLLAQGAKSQYDKSLEFIARADELKINHAHTAMCNQVASNIAELKQRFVNLR